MKTLRNISIQSKLFLGFTMLLVVVMVIIMVAYNGLSSIRNTQERLTEVEFPLTVELYKLRTNLNRERFLLSRLISLPSEKEVLELNNELARFDTENKDIIEKLKELGKDNPEIMIGLGQFKLLRKNYENLKDTLLNKYIRFNMRREAEMLIRSDMYNVAEDARVIVLGLAEISEDNDTELKQLTDTIYHSVVKSFVLLAFIFVAVCIFLAFLLVRYIAKPIRTLASQAEKIAYGNLSLSIAADDGTDEISVMKRSFGMMVESLKSVSLEIKDSVVELGNVSDSMQAKLETGFPDTASMIQFVENNTESIKSISGKLNSLMSEFKL